MQLRDLKRNQRFTRADGQEPNKAFEVVQRTPNQIQIRLAGVLTEDMWCFSNEFTETHWVDCLLEVKIWEYKG